MAKIFDTFSYVIFLSIYLYAYLSFVSVSTWLHVYSSYLSIYLSFSLPLFGLSSRLFKGFRKVLCFDVTDDSFTHAIEKAAL